MISLLLIPIFFELICVSVATGWLYRLYINNQSYIRDVFMLVACHINGMVNVLLSMWVILKQDKYITFTVPLLLLNYCVISLYLMSNVKTSSVKWLANILKAIVLLLTVYVLVNKNTIMIQIGISSIIVIDFFFANVNNNSFSTKLADFLVGSMSFLVAYCYEMSLIVKSLSIYVFCGAVLLLNIVQLGYAYHRIGDVVEMITPEKSFRHKLKTIRKVKKEKHSKVKSS